MRTTATQTTQEHSDRWAPVRQLPPSAKLVAKELDRHDTLTQTELAETTLLSARTVRQAISRLEAVEAVESRVSFRDARKQIYTVTL